MVAVGTRADLTAAWPGASRWDLPEAAILPYLVDRHTNLELSALPPPTANGTFATWLVALIERRQGIPVSALLGRRQGDLIAVSARPAEHVAQEWRTGHERAWLQDDATLPCAP